MIDEPAEIVLRLENLLRAAQRQLELAAKDQQYLRRLRAELLSRGALAWRQAEAASENGDDTTSSIEHIERTKLLEHVVNQIDPDAVRLDDAYSKWGRYVEWLTAQMYDADRIYAGLRERSRLLQARDDTLPAKESELLQQILSTAHARWPLMTVSSGDEAVNPATDASAVQHPDVGGQTIDDPLTGYLNPRLHTVADAQEVTSKSIRNALFITALPIEAAAVRDHLPEGGAQTPDQHGTVAYDGAYTTANGGNWRVRVIATGAKNENAAVITAIVARDFAPDFVFFAGVAGSVKNIHDDPSEVSLGDIVSSATVYPLAGKLIGKTTKITPHSIPTSYALEQAVAALAADDALHVASRGAAWHTSVIHPPDAPTPARLPRAFHKPIIATDFVVKSRSHPLFKQLVSAYPDAYAVDMESFGFFSAMRVLEYRGLVVRGLSDNLDGKNASDDRLWQPAAARNAAAYCFAILSKLDGGAKP